MSVNGITSSYNNSSTGFCLSYGVLSEETRRKLIQLGIDPNTVTSETQAQMLIREKELKIQQVTKTDAESNTKNTNLSEQEILSKVKQLAQQVGLNVTSNQGIGDVFERLAEKIKENGDESLKKEFSSLKSDYEQISTTQNSIYNSMDMSANINKLYLGL